MVGASCPIGMPEGSPGAEKLNRVREQKSLSEKKYGRSGMFFDMK